VNYQFRAKPALMEALIARANELTARSPVDVTASDVIRIACEYYLRTAPSDPAQQFGPDVWVRT